MWALRTFWWVRKGSTIIRDEVAKIPEAINPQKGVVKKGCGHEIENCQQVQFCS
jgi:hypothetical protein